MHIRFVSPEMIDYANAAAINEQGLAYMFGYLDIDELSDYIRMGRDCDA